MLKIRKWFIESEIIEIQIPNIFLNGHNHTQSCLKYFKILLNFKHFRKNGNLFYKNGKNIPQTVSGRESLREGDTITNF